ncbi:CRISPR-associated protein Cas4 [Candidatus Magnetominusculus xianensis]|uniref:CRISPR-associated exonuclease Cas4 n=1 Tax=Candidatus Magnetominusculus xianensis TaxID=1748249 RepID=A0ABR5SDY2_9BACT|nr:CRISPR-associated protein Cas4 [Candidatus Magnetominusculus xianensis]KWT83497.1 CRISPR-associated protein Cas4 [Candidatus Magnetominusculus xianensis]MBF0404137.1 CRISPR-associated protein Cas4 [Nitrospirota bacterium]
MLYAEDDLLPLSALQHLLFCERQCALIHIEQVWDENLFTAEGRILHEQVDSGKSESRRDIKISTGVVLRSLALGLSGKADVVEFHRIRSDSKLKDVKWQPFPVEYKRGIPKKGNYDVVQLCAQALCLEEMLCVKIEHGAMFYGKTKRRLNVLFDAALRQLTEKTALRLHQLIDSGATPMPQFGPKCKNCSLIEICMPQKMKKGSPVEQYLRKYVEIPGDGDVDDMEAGR